MPLTFESIGTSANSELLSQGIIFHAENQPEAVDDDEDWGDYLECLVSNVLPVVFPVAENLKALQYQEVAAHE